MESIIKTRLEKFIGKIEPMIKAIDGPDYYIAQSGLELSPELLIIGINPAGKKKLSESIFSSKEPENIIQEGNQYYLNPDWRISKALNYMFSGDNTIEAYKKANIINYIAINTANEKELKIDEFKDIVKHCCDFSYDLIYNVLKPKKILLLGPKVAEFMKIKFHHRNDSVLRTDDDKSYLVIKVEKENIPHYIIFHPSMPALNDNHNLNKKKDFFEKIFSSEF